MGYRDFGNRFRGNQELAAEYNTEHRLGAIRRQPVEDSDFPSGIYPANATDYLIAITELLGARTIQLPNATQLQFDYRFWICDETGTANSNNVTVLPHVGQTINGGASHVINSNFGNVLLYTDRENWFILSSR